LGGRPLQARSMAIPGDLSSAAFWLVAAAIVPGSDLLLEGVGLNPTRTGILDALGSLGAEIELQAEAEEAGEPIGDIRIRSGELRPIRVGGELLVRAIDEIPILALAMSCAPGRSEIRDATELRVKESDRLATTAHALRALGAQIEELPDGLAIDGPTRWHTGEVDAQGDHRIAMMAAVAALLADGPVTIHGTASTETSYPGFWQTLESFTGCSP
ncbi:MAG: 3-phosphoshikimate 1-carboxyvinyltransferase, partial [Cyanobacteria bacterium REEB65]|nr:3-phosphoshikimate 1-carboxyvinyltransferase [Cyanobacteria bacterium REEB65]